MRTINLLLRKNKRELDRSMSQLIPLRKKTDSLIKAAVKAKDLKTARLYAKERVHIDRQYSKLHMSKARVDSIAMSINEQWLMNKLTQSMQALTVVMKEVNLLINLGVVLGTMQELSKELMTAGIINEMVDDMVDVDDMDDALEEDATAEIDKIIESITEEKLLKSSATVPEPFEHAPALDAELDEPDDMEALSEMRERLNALT